MAPLPDIPKNFIPLCDDKNFCIKIIDGSIWTLNNDGEYEQVTVGLQPGRGYWVKLQKINN